MHRGAVEYDLRQRFGLGLFDIDGQTITLQEVARLMVIIRNDPSSAIAAALEGWDHPISYETLVLADVYDLLAAVNSPKHRRPKPHTVRPWKPRGSERRMGDTGGRTREQIERILADARRGEAVTFKAEQPELEEVTR